MKFEEAYLTDLVKGRSRGDFAPFSSGKWKRSDKYLKQLVGRWRDISSVDLTADFDHYGSGFSSYVHLYLSKSDKSDVSVTEQEGLKTEETNGLMIYLCRLAPFAVYGEGTWSVTYNHGKRHSGSSHFLEPQTLETLPDHDWTHELIEIRDVSNQYGITFLTKIELDQKIDFPITIPTVLSDPPYTVFDCFFYWCD